MTRRERLLAEIEAERYLPVLPPPPLVTPRARQVAHKTKTEIDATAKRRPTGTGWPA